jgi:hypothetical protein
MAHTAVLDGEIACIDAEGRPWFYATCCAGAVTIGLFVAGV